MDLSEAFLSNLVDTIRTDNTVAIVLTGSFARGDANKFSDADILHFVHKLTPALSHYTLMYVDDILVSVSESLMVQKRKELERPETAIWAVQGLRQAKVLLDEGGEFGALQSEALSFIWDKQMQQLAREYASEALMGFAEEAHKILGGLLVSDESRIMYATYGMVLGMVRIIAVANGILLRTENDYFRHIQDVIEDEAVLFYLPIAAGFTRIAVTEEVLPRMRGIAALKLFEKTSDMLRSIIKEEHATVIDKAITVIHQSGLISTNMKRGHNE